MPYVITCGDEGVQVNNGVRLGVVGAGVNVANFDQVVNALKKLFKEELRIAATAESDWIKEQFNLNTFEQADATMQQQVEALADRLGLLYAGFLPFADPQDLAHGIRGHMVRPKGIHIANKLVFTLGGGEQTYNLGRFLVSAEWVHAVDSKVAAEVLKTQVDFYQKLAGDPLAIMFETQGTLPEDIIQKNRAVLEKLGYQPTA